MKKVIFLLVALILVLCISAGAYGASRVPTFYVKESLSDSEEDSPYYYETLAAALEVIATGIEDEDDEDAEPEPLKEAIIYIEKNIDLYNDEEFEDATITFDDDTYPDLLTLTIIGRGSARIIGSGTTRHIIVDNNSFTLKLQDIVLDGDAGGVWVQTGAFEAQNVTFRGLDTSKFEDADEMNGGAIHVTRTGRATITSSTFEMCSSPSGGAVSIEGLRDVRFSGTNTFESCVATEGEGGAIYISSGVTATFEDSPTFRLNKAETTGGAVHNDGTATFSGSPIFQENEAKNGDGGAIYNTGTLRFTGSPEFTANRSTENGGAISNSGGTLTLSSSGTFAANTAVVDGGAINTTGGDVNITGVHFGTGTEARQNSAANGGALSVSGGNVNITNTGFNTNQATNNGGAIYNSTGTLTLRAGNTISGNTAANGGAIYLDDLSSVVLNMTAAISFTQNIATGDGGAIYADRNPVINAAALVTFSENQAANGGALWIRAGTQLSGFRAGADFSSNKAEYGGAIYVAITNISTVTLSPSVPFTFTDNTSTHDGGAIYTVQADVVISGQDITTQNTAEGGGGLIYSGGAVTVTNSTISKQQAQFGGAIYANGKITVDNSDFNNNSTTTEARTDFGGGGAIYANGDIEITSSDFTDNRSISPNAYQGGGALYISGDATITGTRFHHNTHTNNGSGNNGGGAIHVNLGGLTMNQCRFTSNAAAGSGPSQGGAIYAREASISVADSYFQSNTSSRNGGALLLAGACVSILQQTTFLSNVSTGSNGGAIDAQGTLTMNLCYFSSNRSSNNGGAIYFNQHNNASTPGTFTSTSTMYSLNSAGSAPSNGVGGALYIEADMVDINRNTFEGNQSATSNGDSRGGAAYIDMSGSASTLTSSIKNSVFFNNKVSGGVTNYGGAVYTRGNLTINACSVTKNISIERGGGLYVDTGTLTMLATIVVGNEAANGKDVYAEGTVSSRGYNRIGIYGAGGTDTSWSAYVSDSTNDRENITWTTATFFGEDAGLVHEDTYHTAPRIGTTLLDAVYLLALVLHEAEDLPIDARATNVIPYSSRYTLNVDQYDIWDVDRYASGNDISIGAHYSSGSPNRGVDEEKELYDIASITMSGIPNTLKNPGQTASLVAVIHYVNGRTAYAVPYDKLNVTKNVEERVTWISSIPNFVTIDKSGNITALRATMNSTGARITVKTVRKTPSGTEAEASRQIIITEDSSYLNISPTYWTYITEFIETLEHDISVAFADVDTATVNNSLFRSNFAASWNAEPTQITELTSSTPEFNTYTSNNVDGLTAIKNSAVNINFQNRNTGDLLPITYSWSFTGSELKEIIGYDLTGRNITGTLADALFEKLRVSYQTANGTNEVVGGDGVSGSEAMDAGALKLTQSDGGAGLLVQLTAYLANVNASGIDDGPKIISSTGTRKALVVPDGADDGAITGMMWMLQSSTNATPAQQDNPSYNNNGDDSGGGGGCASFSIGLLGLVLLLKRR